MALTLTQLRAKVRNLLNRLDSYTGFYTDAKTDDALNESLDYVSARMMQEGEGWQQVVGFLSTTSGVASYALPSACSIITAVRYLYGDMYVPLIYDDQSSTSQTSSTSQLSQYPSTFRIVGNSIYFNPVPASVGTNYLQLEYTAYPAELVSGSDTLGLEFDRALARYVVYRAAGILLAQTGKAQPDWALYEQQWYSMMETIISKRTRLDTHIGMFRQ
jgi:hypothetical protein